MDYKNLYIYYSISTTITSRNISNKIVLLRVTMYQDNYKIVADFIKLC